MIEYWIYSGDSNATPEQSIAENSEQLPQWNSCDDKHEVCEPTSRSEPKIITQFSLETICNGYNSNYEYPDTKYTKQQ